MEELIAKLNAAGLSVTADMDSGQIQKIASAMGINPLDYVKRSVEIKQHTNKRGETNTFAVSQPFVIGQTKDGKVKTTGGLFLRIEVVEQALADLLVAREKLKG